jgi:hypothetical protein
MLGYLSINYRPASMLLSHYELKWPYIRGQLCNSKMNPFPYP